LPDAAALSACVAIAPPRWPVRRSAPRTALRGTRYSTRHTDWIRPIQKTVDAGYPRAVVACMAGSSWSSLITASNVRKSPVRPVQTSPAMVAERDGDVADVMTPRMIASRPEGGLV
jgi:hypothetical protein